MDDLLNRLRHDMVELSCQGDNFTRQIWLMYGQFEQVVDQFNDTSSTTATTTLLSPKQSDSADQQQQRPEQEKEQENSRTLSTGIMTEPVTSSSSQQPHRRRRITSAARPLEFSSSGCSSNGSSNGSSGEESDGGSFSDCGEPLGYRLSRPAAGRASSRSISSGQNPLLETISVIGDLCNDDDSSDDCVDAGGPSYAGSNSVDSGYKSSCCPTPVPPKHPQSQQQHNSSSSSSSAAAAAAAAAAKTLLSAAVSSSTSSTQLLDLDHLTSLRRTLLTAIERCDADNSQTADHRLPQQQQQQQQPPVSSSAASTDRPGETVEEQDGAVRFSRVARCMLEIIEDLQRQQQSTMTMTTTTTKMETTAATESVPVVGKRNPTVPPKPARKLLQTAVNNRSNSVPLLPAPATPPRVARRGRRKLPTPQPPVEEVISSSSGSSNSSQLSGADYHLYEEILYDLAAPLPSFTAKTPVELPPPLPARPARPNPTSVSVAAAAAAAATASKPWLNVIRPLRRDRNNQLIRSTSSHCWSSATSTTTSSSASNKLHHADQISARSNVYTFGSNQPTLNNVNNNNKNKLLPPTTTATTIISSSSSSSSRLNHHHPLQHHHHHQHLEEGEYGFRAAMV